MDPELRDILYSVSTENSASNINLCNNNAYTHTTYHPTPAKWNIPDQHQMPFWERYCNLTWKHESEGNFLADVCLAEKADGKAPTTATFTFRYLYDENDTHWEPYDEKLFHWLVYAYQTAIMENFNINEQDHIELVAVILESSTHWFEEIKNDKVMALEVKLHFPYAKIDINQQQKYIRPRAIQILNNCNVMSVMGRTPMISNWDQIISQINIASPYLMYGSTDYPKKPKLVKKHIWGYISDTMIDVVSEGWRCPELALNKIFFPANHYIAQSGIVSPDAFDSQELEFWMPMFLSVGYWQSVLLLRDEVSNANKNKTTTGQNFQQYTENINIKQLNANSNNRNNSSTKYVNLDAYKLDSDIELAEMMLSMISNDRYFAEATWIDIGKALYTCDNGGNNGLYTWMRYTEKAVNGCNIMLIPDHLKTASSIRESCRNVYDTFGKNNNITIKTLAWYAREDSPEQYGDWHQNWCKSSMDVALSGLHTDVAVALYRVYWLDFVYCSIGRGQWYLFSNHRWSLINQGIALRRAISRDFVRRFEHVRMGLLQENMDSNDEDLRARNEATCKKITAIICKLKTVAFKSSLMTEVSEFFNHETFENLLDINPELTGVTNGILEIVGNVVNFRKAKPEDYISMCSNTPYHENYSWDHELVNECLTWIGQVFTDKLLLHHFLKFAASALKGCNEEKIFPIFTGNGNNSKSMIVKLFEATLSSYCIKFPVALLTDKNGNASGPTPQLARAKSTRLAFIDEPEDDVPLHKGTIKRYTGGDRFFARKLQENGGDITATFKMVMSCNNVPMIDCPDQAVKDRTKIFPFLSKWVNDPPEDIETQYLTGKFKKNARFEHRIAILAPAFLWIMVQYFTNYVNEGLEDPQIVIDHTENYWKNNDIYAQFAADMIQEVYTSEGQRDRNHKASISEIYAEFKEWFHDNIPNTKTPDRKAVKSELIEKWGPMVGNSWHGIRIMTEDAADMSSALGDRNDITIKGIDNKHINNFRTADGTFMPPHMAIVYFKKNEAMNTPTATPTSKSNTPTTTPTTTPNSKSNTPTSTPANMMKGYSFHSTPVVINKPVFSSGTPARLVNVDALIANSAKFYQQDIIQSCSASNSGNSTPQSEGSPANIGSPYAASIAANAVESPVNNVGLIF